MKKAVLFVFVAILLQSCMSLQQVTVSKSEQVIEVPGTKDELYVKANEWMVRSFNNAKSVIQFQDKEAGKIMGKYLLHGSSQSAYDTYAIITLAVKDGATKIDIEPTGTWSYDASGLTIYNYSKEKAQEDIDNLIADYKSYMASVASSW